MNDALERLNALARDLANAPTPMRTQEELLHFFKNPPKNAYSVPLENAMTSVVKMFEVGDQSGRQSIASHLNEHARNAFLGYAATMAVLAVRTQSSVLIKQGLIALVIEGGSQDWRDSVVVLAKLYHSAVKLGMDAQQVFEEVASMAAPGIMKTEMEKFPLRRPDDRDPAAFYESEEGAGESFRYKQILPWPVPQDGGQETPAGRVESPQQISARLNRDQRNALIGMAGALAAMAVRQQSPKLIEQGLQGLAMGGGNLVPSHSLAALAKLHHSALKLGMNAATAFAEAARLAPPGELQNEMIRFPLRDPKDRDLAAFNLEEAITENGFSYKQTS